VVDDEVALGVEPGGVLFVGHLAAVEVKPRNLDAALRLLAVEDLLRGLIAFLFEQAHAPQLRALDLVVGAAHHDSPAGQRHHATDGTIEIKSQRAAQDDKSRKESEEERPTAAQAGARIGRRLAETLRRLQGLERRQELLARWETLGRAAPQT